MAAAESEVRLRLVLDSNDATVIVNALATLWAALEAHGHQLTGAEAAAVDAALKACERFRPTAAAQAVR